MAEEDSKRDRPVGRPRPTEAEAVAEVVADLTAAGAPLAGGLRAAAREAPTRRLARIFDQLARRIERGQSLEAALAAPDGRNAGCAAGLIRAAVRTGKLTEVLIELMDQQRAMRELWRSVRAALAYPAFLLVFAAATFTVLGFLVARPMLQMFEDFELELPQITQVVLWFYTEGIWWVLGAAAALVAAVILFRVVAGAARWRRALATVPLFGVLWHWSGVAEFAHLMAVLVESGVPLGEALRLASDAVHDANVGQVARMLADGVEQGQSLESLLEGTWRLPASLAPIVGWGQRAGELSDAFREVSDMYIGRVHQRAEWLKRFLPPWVFVLVAVMIPAFIFALYLPMVKLIGSLVG